MGAMTSRSGPDPQPGIPPIGAGHPPPQFSQTCMKEMLRVSAALERRCHVPYRRQAQCPKADISHVRTRLTLERVTKRQQTLGRHWAKDVMAVHLRVRSWRSVSTAVATLLLVSLSLSGCSGGGTAVACAPAHGALKGTPGLTTTKVQSSTTLPPSHDNDAGDARIPDHAPDADLDYNQRHHSCLLPK